MGICLALTGSAVGILIIHKYLAIAPAFQFLKVSVGQKIENVSVSHKIENVSVSHKIENVSVGHKIVTIVYFILFLINNSFFSQVLGICLAPTGSAVRNLIIHKYSAVAPTFQFLKVSVGQKIENVSVSHKIENVSVSHKIVI